MQTELAIGLKLRLGKELIRRGLLRKVSVNCVVLRYVFGLIAGEAGFEIQEPSGLTLRVEGVC
jgi:hypothetical protein